MYSGEKEVTSAQLRSRSFSAKKNSATLETAWLATWFGRDPFLGTFSFLNVFKFRAQYLLAYAVNKIHGCHTSGYWALTVYYFPQMYCMFLSRTQCTDSACLSFHKSQNLKYLPGYFRVEIMTSVCGENGTVYQFLQ